jgi:hypothetical protein
MGGAGAVELAGVEEVEKERWDRTRKKTDAGSSWS